MLDTKRPVLQSQVFFLIILGTLMGLTWLVFKPFVIYMTIGVLVAVLALPIDRIWEKILPNSVAAFGTLFTVFVILLAPVVGLGFAMVGEAEAVVHGIESGELQDTLYGAVEAVTPWMSQEERNETLLKFWDQAEPLIQDFIVQAAQDFLTSLPNIMIAFTVILFVVYYVLVDGERLVKWLRRAAPLPPRQVDYLLEEAHGGVKGVFFGQILTSLAQGALGGLGFFMVGLPAPILWAAVMAVLSLLPVIGTPVVWIPAVIFLFAEGEITKAIILLAWSGILVMQVDNFLRPILIGNRTDIHPLFVLVGVLGGVAAFGFVGLFLGPLLVGVTVSILKVWEADYLDPSLQGHKHEEDVDYDEIAEEIGKKMDAEEAKEAKRQAKEAKKADKAEKKRGKAEKSEEDSDGPPSS